MSPMRQTGQHPGELRRVDRWHLHHCHADVAAVMQELTAQRLVEPLDGMLGATVRRLQGYAAIGKRRPHLDDGAGVSRQHALERSLGAVHVTEVADLRNPLEFIRAHLHERREDRTERPVHPYVDRSQLRLRLAGRCLHLISMRDIGGDDQRLTARCLDIVGGAGQPLFASRQQGHLRSPASEGGGGRPPDACASAGDNNYLRLSSGHQYLRLRPQRAFPSTPWRPTCTVPRSLTPWPRSADLIWLRWGCPTGHVVGCWRWS